MHYHDTDEFKDKLRRAKKLMELLGISVIPNPPDYWPEIYAHELYDIFMDEDKLRILVSKLRNKAFW